MILQNVNNISYRFVIFKTPIDNTSWSSNDVLQHCPEMTDEESGCLIINIKPNREATFWYDEIKLIIISSLKFINIGAIIN